MTWSWNKESEKKWEQTSRRSESLASHPQPAGLTVCASSRPHTLDARVSLMFLKCHSHKCPISHPLFCAVCYFIAYVLFPICCLNGRCPGLAYLLLPLFHKSTSDPNADHSFALQHVKTFHKIHEWQVAQKTIEPMLKKPVSPLSMERSTIISVINPDNNQYTSKEHRSNIIQVSFLYSFFEAEKLSRASQTYKRMWAGTVAPICNTIRSTRAAKVNA